VAALRADGIAAPLVLDGAIDGGSFLSYVEQFLAPALRPGDVLVMDNLPSYKVAGVREAVEAAGVTLRYLPPYSPDLNPVRGTAPNAGLRQAQGPAAVRSRPHRRGAVGRRRPPARTLPDRRVRPLHGTAATGSQSDSVLSCDAVLAAVLGAGPWAGDQ